MVSHGGFDMHSLVASDVEHLSCAYLSSVFLLTEMSVPVFCPFVFGHCIFLLGIVSSYCVPYTFGIQILY